MTYLWYGPIEQQNFMLLAHNHHAINKFPTATDKNQIPFLDKIGYRGRENYIQARLYQKPTDNKRHSSSLETKSIPYGLLIRCKRNFSKQEDFKQEANILCYG